MTSDPVTFPHEPRLSCFEGSRKGSLRWHCFLCTHSTFRKILVGTALFLNGDVTSPGLSNPGLAGLLSGWQDLSAFSQKERDAENCPHGQN